MECERLLPSHKLIAGVDAELDMGQFILTQPSPTQPIISYTLTQPSPQTYTSILIT